MPSVSNADGEKGAFGDAAQQGLETAAGSEAPSPAWREEFLAAGYRPYHDAFKGRGEENAPDDQRMYVGSVQKRVRDDRGTRYFVNVDLYDFTMHQGGRRSASASVSFQMADEDWSGSTEVSRHVEGAVSETEAWFADLWGRMGWGYYEVDNGSVPPPNRPSALPASAGRD